MTLFFEFDVIDDMRRRSREAREARFSSGDEDKSLVDFDKKASSFFEAEETDNLLSDRDTEAARDW